MTGEGPATWAGAVPLALVTLLVLLLPGWVGVRLLGVRGFPALAVAPAVSVTTISVAGVVAPWLGLDWGLPPLVLGCLVTWALSAGLGRLLRRRRPPDEEPVRSLPYAVRMYGGALAVAAVLVAAVYLPVSGGPEAFPQHPDTIFHLGTIQLMSERGDASSLHAAGLTAVSGTGFYPAAFHAVAVTTLQLTGASVAASASVLAFVLAALVWPAGCVLLARVVLGPRPAVVLATAVTSVAFSAFPYWLLGYGVLWPNLLGYALLPAALACLALATAPPGVPADRARAALLLAAVVPGLALAHPNAVFGLAVLGYFAVARGVLGWAWSVRGGRAIAAAAGFLALTGLALAAFAVLTRRSTLMRRSNPLGPEVSKPDAWVDLLSQSPRGLPSLWVLGITVLAGAFVLLLRRGQRWMLAALLAAGGLLVMVTGVDSTTTRWLTWPWYNNPPRLAGLVVVPAVVAASAALALVAEALGRRGGRRPALWPALAVPAVLLVVTGAYIGPHRDVLRPYFSPSPGRTFVSDAELDALRTLGGRTADDAVIAADPWKGGSYLYLVSGRTMLFPTEKTLGAGGDRRLLAQRLDDVGASPEVCAAARRQGVRFAITGGEPPGVGARASRQYAGVDAVGSSAAFRPVAEAGPYRLYELVRCAGG